MSNDPTNSVSVNQQCQCTEETIIGIDAREIRHKSCMKRQACVW